MKLTITSTTGEFVTLCECKEYLKVNDESRDDLIMRCAKMATTFVEHAINESLCNHDVKLVTNLDFVHSLYLYPVGVINSVKDVVTGEDVAYTTDIDKECVILGSNAVVQIIYTTVPSTETNEAAKMATLALTSLIYDGVTDRAEWNAVITNYLADKLPL